MVDLLHRAPGLVRPGRAAERLADGLDGLPPGHDLLPLAADARVKPLLLALADHSPFLWRLAVADPDRLVRLLRQPAEASLSACLARLAEDCAAATIPRDAMPALRRARAEVALLVALADLGGLWDLDAVVGALTAFADRAVSCAVEALARDAVATGRLLPGTGEAAGCGLAILAMGKGGGGELNYSSDIDIVAFYDPGASRLPPGTPPGPFYVRLVQGLVRLLGEFTADGYVLRVDLRLRPDPASTAVAVSIPAALSYYEASGQTWERAAFIKARPIAGDLALGARFLSELAPFIWRRYFDYAAIADIHAMKRQITAFRGHGAVAIPGHDLKVGRGGIREIEFFVQTQQLIFGGRRPALRGSGTLAMLAELAADGWIDRAAATELSAAYGLLRRVEHRLQMVDDQQTQRLPTDPDGLDHIALFAGYPDRPTFETALRGAMHGVEAHYARLFEQAPRSEAEGEALVFSGDGVDPATVEAFRRLGFRAAAEAVETVRGWHFGRRPAIRSPRAGEVLAGLVPVLLESFSRSGDPDAALKGFDTVLGRLPAAVELFGILKSNPDLRQLYADLLGAAPRLAATVAARPHLLDAAIDPALQRDPDPETVMARVAAAGPAFEDVLDRARDVAREEQFLIGLRLLSGVIAPACAGRHHSDLAAAVLRALLGRVERDFALEHGRVPGGTFAVVAMGKLGSREMTATSDLDLLMVYDADPAGPESDGPRPLAAARYYTRLTQRLIAALTAATRRGPLYAVDMRLRPSGNQGPVATQFAGFVRYQADQAETWEQMALTRARVVAGEAGLGDRIAAAVRACLMRGRDDRLRGEVAELRALVERGKPHGGPWDLKLAPGAQLDVEFLAQYLVLRHARDHPGLVGLSTTGALRHARDLGLLSQADGEVLVAAATLYTDVTQVIRLAVDGSFDVKAAGEGLRRRIAQAAGLPDFATLDRHLADMRATVRHIFDATLHDVVKAGLRLRDVERLRQMTVVSLGLSWCDRFRSPLWKRDLVAPKMRQSAGIVPRGDGYE